MSNFIHKLKYFVFILLVSPLLSNAQDMKAVKSNIKTLCSKPFYGRGYTFEGDKKAATFIRNKFEKYGVSKFPGHSSFYQEYNLEINTFPKETIVKINSKKLKLGQDYIPTADAGVGSFLDAELIEINNLVFTNEEVLKDFLKRNLKGKVVSYDMQHERKWFSWNRALIEKIMQAEASVVFYDDKLTFSQSRWQSPKPRFYISRQALPENITSISFSSQPKFIENYTSQNVIGYIKGQTNPEKYIILSAHYDHLGSIGKKCYFAGANDNASGVSMLLELAKYYTTNPPNYSVVLISFGSEEAGLIGSRYYVEHPYFPLDQIKFVINLDLFGSGEEGIMAVNGSVYKDQFQLLEKINAENKYLIKVGQRGKAANSDHYFFSENNVPSFFFYLMGKSWTHYHDIYDTPQLPLSGFPSAYKLIIDFSNALQSDDN